MLNRLASTLLCAVVAATSCANLPKGPESPLPENSVRYTPPAPYEDWWREIEGCAGRVKDMAFVRWYRVVNGGPGFVYQGDSLAGLAFGNLNTIVMGSGFVANPWVVRHEILHLVAPPYNGHDPKYFRGKCRDLVVCVADCLADPGPAGR